MDYITKQIDQYRPIANALADTTRAYADRIILLLSAIHDAVAEEEYDETRRFTQVTVPATGLVDAGAIPSDGEWIVESVTVDTLGTYVIYLDGMIRWIGTAAGPITLAGNNAFLKGPGTVTLAAMSGGPAKALVQIKMKTPKPPRQARSGTRDPLPDIGTTMGDRAITNGRHAGTWEPTKADPPVGPYPNHY
jgi:hypothetical protein